MTKAFAWSYSALTSFETCPHRHFKTKIEKSVIEPQTDALTWGNKVHKSLEVRVKAGFPLPTDMRQWEPIAVAIDKSRQLGGKVDTELKMAINDNFKPVSYFAKDCWSRSITDVSVEKGDKIWVGDYKTGKPTPDSQQLMLSAAFVFHHKPYINTVQNSFIWLKSGGMSTETYHRDDVSKIWQEFMPRVERLKTAIELDKFPKNPSGLCREWCPVKTCEHNGAYKG